MSGSVQLGFSAMRKLGRNFLVWDSSCLVAMWRVMCPSCCCSDGIQDPQTLRRHGGPIRDQTPTSKFVFG